MESQSLFQAETQAKMTFIESPPRGLRPRRSSPSGHVRVRLHVLRPRRRQRSHKGFYATEQMCQRKVRG